GGGGGGDCGYGCIAWAVLSRWR
ncbi:Hypothetical protein NocV09_05800050, partial [Nannochloropsis oceanica]